jgi:hypothetical protein
MGIVSELVKDIVIPRMAKVRQIFPRERIEDIPSALRTQLTKGKIEKKIKAIRY